MPKVAARLAGAAVLAAILSSKRSKARRTLRGGPAHNVPGPLDSTKPRKGQKDPKRMPKGEKMKLKKGRKKEVAHLKNSAF